MDLTQRKLNKSEWDSVEVPVSTDENEVLDIIKKGFNNVNIKYNKTKTLYSFLKIEHSEPMEDYLFTKYFDPIIRKLLDKYESDTIDSNQVSYLTVAINSKPLIKKADLIRLEKNTLEYLKEQGIIIYENLILEELESLLKFRSKRKADWQRNYFTIYKMIKNNIENLNRHISQIIRQMIAYYDIDINMPKFIERSVNYIEKNEKLLKYSDMALYEHQKELFVATKQPGAKLILYIAPTGTGKTLSPIGLCEPYVNAEGITKQNRIIFVCAARHVGLALAKSAISANKKIAFAFGCASSADIRLHYFAAKDFTKNYRTGGIWKVDNSIGDDVELIICDVKSYLPAMFYMLSFNSAENMITYWDEPTITFDYETHEFHELIQKNWIENLIPNMVLSSATLPKVHEIPLTIADFRNKFEGAEIISIVSHDCKKTIPLIDKNGYVTLPHYMSDDYKEIEKIVAHCENYLTLLRYFDLDEVVKFIIYLNDRVPNKMKIERHFATLDDMDMINIKLHYIRVLKCVCNAEMWSDIYHHFASKREKRISANESVDTKGNQIITKVSSVGPGIASANKSSNEDSTVFRKMMSVGPGIPIVEGASASIRKAEAGDCAIYVTTKDAYTLTDGPTIFLAKDVEKIAKFCIQQANIPVEIMQEITKKILYNNQLNEKIDQITKNLEDIINAEVVGETADGSKKTHKINREQVIKQGKPGKTSVNNVKPLRDELTKLYAAIKCASLNDLYIPNKFDHLNKWAKDIDRQNIFTSDVDDETIIKIMMLANVDNNWKVLLLMGIGVMTNHESIEYTEIMKELANSQRLYLIIASSDYIYGTNYQFCHGYLSKDMELTQEKLIQAMGRIGRNKIQQSYTVRFRDDEQLQTLFKSNADKPEIRNMNRLFNALLG